MRTLIISFIILFVGFHAKANDTTRKQVISIETSLIGGGNCFLSTMNSHSELTIYNKGLIYHISKNGDVVKSIDFEKYLQVKEIDYSSTGALLLKAVNDECIYSIDMVTDKVTKHQFNKPEDWYVLKNAFCKELFEGITWIPFMYYSENKRKQIGTKFHYGVNLFITDDSIVYSALYRQWMKIYEDDFYSIGRKNIWLSDKISSASKILGIVDDQIVYINQGRELFKEKIFAGNPSKIKINIHSPCLQKVEMVNDKLMFIEIVDGCLILYETNLI